MHNNGDTRIRERFLILPKRINKEWRWWKREKWMEIYRVTKRPGPVQPGPEISYYKWIPIAWVEK